jgi:UDP-N-acetylmuramoylalanine--D-glutamate ligase
LSNWRDKKVIVLGLARQGKALARYFASEHARVIVSDVKPIEELQDEMVELEGLSLEYELGGHPVTLLEGAAALFLSGGIPTDLPVVRGALEKGIPVSNDSQLFFDLCLAPIIGITGSAGKSTTTELVGRIGMFSFDDLDRKVWVGGNLGRPLLLDLDSIRAHDVAVVELSSFQLEWMTLSPHVAALLNITPNHLDRHGTMDAYRAAKMNILHHQTSEDIAILNREDAELLTVKSEINGRLLTFGINERNLDQGTFVREGNIWLRMAGREIPVCPLESIQLRGMHNLLNVTAASAIAAGIGFPLKAIEPAVRSFKGLPHRLEFVREVNGVEWVNDSIATSPERAIAAINVFDEPLILLAGGRDKDLPWREFADLVKQRVDHLILFGEARQKIEKEVGLIDAGGRPLTLSSYENLGDAIAEASQIAQEGDVVLLAPGGTSFDQFNDFAARGDYFRQVVEKI